MKYLRLGMHRLQNYLSFYSNTAILVFLFCCISPPTKLFLISWSKATHPNHDISPNVGELLYKIPLIGILKDHRDLNPVSRSDEEALVVVGSQKFMNFHQCVLHWVVMMSRVSTSLH